MSSRRRLRLEHVGPVGAGATTKLAVTLPLIASWQALGEAASLIRPLAIEPGRFVDLLSDTAGAPAVLKLKADVVAATMAGEDRVETTFEIDAMREDLQLMIETSTGRLPVASAALSAIDEISAAGWGHRDCSWVPAFRR